MSPDEHSLDERVSGLGDQAETIDIRHETGEPSVREEARRLIEAIGRRGQRSARIRTRRNHRSRPRCSNGLARRPRR